MAGRKSCRKHRGDIAGGGALGDKPPKQHSGVGALTGSLTESVTYKTQRVLPGNPTKSRSPSAGLNLSITVTCCTPIESYRQNSHHVAASLSHTPQSFTLVTCTSAVLSSKTSYPAQEVSSTSPRNSRVQFPGQFSAVVVHKSNGLPSTIAEPPIVLLHYALQSPQLDTFQLTIVYTANKSCKSVCFAHRCRLLRVAAR